ncbi:hypothetical protein N0V84_005892 [Fusarium piperis]|uniref:AB hydrolase-1 domain-containing protein n=1 Tax=Fusarium piperis TaxID=1435070 RepID=A0A9W8WCX9_9HYPO|nr:hypothetical protein N0V84_005892 [Fusarium piperis]
MFKPIAFFTLFAAASARKCTDITVPVSLKAENAVFDLDKPLTKVDVTDFILNLSRQGDNFVQGINKGTTVITGNYKLAATYCEPDYGPGDEIQIMTHGIGFDRSYWDMSYNKYNYSYVAKAVDEHKYSTLTWDRLGIGASSKGHPIDEIQVFLEIAALKELTRKARKGLLPGIKAKYSKAVHIGHSFGSVISLALANTAPELTDAIVLTGFAQTATYLSLFAVSNNFIPVKDSPNADKYPAGYVATASTVSVHMNFFAEGNFDPQMLKLAYKTAQPTTPGELLTLAGPMLEENSYTGPVFVVTGDRDVPFCGGNCMATGGVDSELPSLLDTSKKYFPKASRLNTTVIPGTGHGMNLEYTCGQTYDAILDFLSE